MKRVLMTLMVILVGSCASLPPARGTPVLQVVTYPQAWGNITTVRCADKICAVTTVNKSKRVRSFEIPDVMPTRLNVNPDPRQRTVRVAQFTHDGQGAIVLGDLTKPPSRRATR